MPVPEKRSARPVSPAPDSAVVTCARDLGIAIIARRRQRSWTQAQLAAAAGLSLRTISRIEAGAPSVAIGLYLQALHAVGRRPRVAGDTKQHGDILRALVAAASPLSEEDHGAAREVARAGRGPQS